MFDPSITVDGVEMWRDGTLDFADAPEVQALQAKYPGMRELFERPVLEFGLGET